MCESCCKRSPCTPNPCKNNGTCSKVDNGYSCSCTPGYLGEHCDVDVCLPNPCKNNGTCSPIDNGCLHDAYKNDGNGYVCNCSTGYLGENCDVNPCDIYNPCINNGACYPSEFGVNCSCPPGLMGEYCQERACELTECKGIGGRCIKQICLSDATNCGGKACTSTNEVCIDGNCVDKSKNCGWKDDIFNYCESIGDKCEDGQYCFSYSNCVNDTCRFESECGPRNTDVCSYQGVRGNCSGGACHMPCSEDKNCPGWICVGGYCATPKCGESYCRV
ncbi:hypothetical protein SNE40_022307 [Patella caerulea]|uniref:EGF-like domain-containing protein n=1 Tax=Patella caerulea TaxID=87958 RepID=A0AAN8G7T9_PATCE